MDGYQKNDLQHPFPPTHPLTPIPSAALALFFFFFCSLPTPMARPLHEMTLALEQWFLHGYEGRRETSPIGPGLDLIARPLHAWPCGFRSDVIIACS